MSETRIASPRHAIAELDPSEDAMVKCLLASRPHIFSHHAAEGFRNAFGGRLELVGMSHVAGMKRAAYHLRHNG
jgi:hypothetical protein